MKGQTEDKKKLFDDRGILKNFRNGDGSLGGHCHGGRVFINVKGKTELGEKNLGLGRSGGGKGVLGEMQGKKTRICPIQKFGSPPNL